MAVIDFKKLIQNIQYASFSTCAFFKFTDLESYYSFAINAKSVSICADNKHASKCIIIKITCLSRRLILDLKFKFEKTVAKSLFRN